MRDFKGRSILGFPDSYTVVDVETTGLDPSCDRLIEVAALKIRDSQVVDSFSSLINPGIEVDDFITKLTGITNEQLSSAPGTDIVMKKLDDFLGDDVLIGHNVHFDINFLYDNFELFLGKPLTNNFIDTLRLSKKYCPKAPSHKLSVLASYLEIPVETSHRSLDDCITTNHLYSKLQEAAEDSTEAEKELLNFLNFDSSNPFFQKRVAVKGIPQLYSYAFMSAIFEKCQAKFGDVFYSSCDYIIFSKYTYQKYLKGEISEKFIKAERLSNAGSLSILSEEDWCKMLSIPIPATSRSSISAKDIVTDKTDFDETHPLFNKLCVFTGTLEKMPRKDAMQLVVDLGGHVGNSVTKKTNFLILGNNDYCPLIKDGKSSKQKKAEALRLAGNDIVIISENVFYDMVSEL